MSSGNDYQKLLIISSLLGILGSIATILGVLLGTDFSLGLTSIYGLVIVGLLAGIFIICLITFISSIRKQGLTANDERPAFFALLVFVLAPTKLFSLYSTPMYYLLIRGNVTISLGAEDFSFYITYIGVALVYLSFIITGLIYLWKNRMSSSSGLNLSGGGGSSNPIIKLLRIIGGILAILASVGIALHIFINEIPSGFDLAAIAFVVMLVAIIISAIILLLGNFGVGNISSKEGPLLVFILIVSIFPGYNPYSDGLAFWASPIIELIYDLDGVFFLGSDNIWHMILLISLIILILAFCFLLVTKFYSSSSSHSARVKVPKSGGGLEARKKKGKFPKGPPTGPPATSGPPGSPPSGPPATGTQPTISSAPPQPPSFMATDAAPATPIQSDDPTCPFCGKGLRYVDEYQRWYCDGCAQYV
ncbi:MAG: hypothetical protein FK733_03825 [Asgard group archaeon]|nr:hypothetical protein [Asgard group archaeon]